MKLKKVKILVEPLKKTNERWVKALQGKLQSKTQEEIITVSNWDVMARILSPPRLQILMMIPVLKPSSVSALAKAMKKDFKNIYSDVKFLSDVGLIELREEGRRKTLIPIAKFDGIELALAS